MKPLLLALLLAGCSQKKTIHIDPSVSYRIYVFSKTCQKQPDLSLICKARFDPQTVRAK